MICFCWKTGININWSFHPETSWKWSADGWLIQSRLSTWQSSPLLIAASVTVKGFRYSNPSAKLGRLTACQITARQPASCACVCSILLSGMRFICRRCFNFVSLWLYSPPVVRFASVLPWIRSHLRPETSSQSHCSTGLQGCALSPSPRSQSKFAGEGPGVSFRPLSHKIPFSAVRGRESTRASASVTEPHQGHTNITSVQLLPLHRCISCVMKHRTESTGQHATLNPDACWTGHTFILQVRKLNVDCHL